MYVHVRLRSPFMFVYLPVQFASCSEGSRRALDLGFFTIGFDNSIRDTITTGSIFRENRLLNFE